MGMKEQEVSADILLNSKSKVRFFAKSIFFLDSYVVSVGKNSEYFLVMGAGTNPGEVCSSNIPADISWVHLTGQ